MVGAERHSMFVVKLAATASNTHLHGPIRHQWHHQDSQVHDCACCMYATQLHMTTGTLQNHCQCG